MEKIKIQMISNRQIYTNEIDKYTNEIDNLVISEINNYSLLKSFDYNIIDLNSSFYWNMKDFETNEYWNIISAIINHSNETKIILMLPQNIHVKYGGLYKSKQKVDYLKNKITFIHNFLSEIVKLKNVKIGYGKIKDTNFDFDTFSDFYFENYGEYKPFPNKIKNDVVTTIIKDNNLILTTLQLKNSSNINNFIKEIDKELNFGSDIPNWFNEISMFDDNKQKKIIEKNNNQINKLKKENKKAENKLKLNKQYESILYKQGKPLEKSVRKILGKLLNYDLNFKEKFNEDFLIELDDVTFIGEIKGVKSNLNNSHLAQLNLNYENKKVNNSNTTFKQLMIINRFREYPPKLRKPIEEEQILMAKNNYNGILIITVESLLKVFEKFCDEEITSNKIIERFKNEDGLFEP